MSNLSRIAAAALACGAFVHLTIPPARGQGAGNVAQDVAAAIAESQRSREQAGNHLGVVHGAAEQPFSRVAGADSARLGEQFPGARPLDVLQGASRIQSPGSDVAADRRPGILPPALPRDDRPSTPLYGPISLPPAEDEGPTDGLTLEQAIVTLARDNPDLAVRFEEISKADADTLTASLWGNPLIAAGANSVPYGSYTPNRPGSNNYNVTVIQPFDLNGKIRARTQLARANKQVLCAQYQDAVRLEAEVLHAAFVDVMAARTTAGYLETSVANFEALMRTTRSLVERGEASEADLDTALVEQETTINARDEAVARLRQAKRELAVLLAAPPSQSDTIELRGSIHDRTPPLPPIESLVDLALRNRPDLAANRLGVRSAVANVELQHRERFADVFASYTPYQFNANDDVYSTRGATSWGAGVFVSVPIMNRNQGNILRARGNLRQTRIEVSGLERRVAADVENAVVEYDSSRAAVDRIERAVLPRADHRIGDVRRLFEAGEESLDTFLRSQGAYNDVVRRYLDALVRHRRAMLALNTAVGVRILP